MVKSFCVKQKKTDTMCRTFGPKMIDLCFGALVLNAELKSLIFTWFSKSL